MDSAHASSGRRRRSAIGVSADEIPAEAQRNCIDADVAPPRLQTLIVNWPRITQPFSATQGRLQDARIVNRRAQSRFYPRINCNSIASRVTLLSAIDSRRRTDSLLIDVERQFGAVCVTG